MFKTKNYGRYIFNATHFDAASDDSLLQSVVIEKEESIISPFIVKRRLDQAFQTVEELVSKYSKLFAKVNVHKNFL